ncbi:MAG: hypothetical protein AB2556_23565 [Candidatus Thiodiazotropha sp.]
MTVLHASPLNVWDEAWVVFQPFLVLAMMLAAWFPPKTRSTSSADLSWELIF